jgi:predicted PhzF superfamily epimerase YddE/YHI9
MKFTETIDAWIPSHCGFSFQDITDITDGGEASKVIGALGYTNHDMTNSGWIKVGAATITVELMNEGDVNSAQMASLKAELQQTRADNQVRENDILDRISKLGALTYEGDA